MKKALSVLLVLLMLVSLFACNKTPDPGTSSSPPTNSTPPSGDTSKDSPKPNTPSDTPADPDAEKYGGILRIVNSAEGAAPIGLPWKTATLESLLLAPFFEGLYIMRTDGVIEPNLASAWEVNMDANEIIVTLNPDIRFHDGSPLNAEAAGWNIMKGVEAKTVNQNIIGYEVRSDLELAVKFDIWSNAILSALASLSLCSKEAYEKNGEDWAAENAVGTGPFIVTEYTRGQVLKAERNPDYWRDGKPYLDGIEFHFIRDAMAQNMAIQAEGAQGIDVLNLNSAEQVSMLKDMGFDTFTLYTGPVSLYPSSMDESSPLSKVEVRKAIAYAIDREALVAARGFGLYTPGDQWVERNSIARLPDSYNITFDLEKSKQLLADAGYPDGFHTTLITQPGVADKDSTVALQKMLEAVGITSDLEFPDAGGYAALRASGWDGICVAGARQFAFVYNSFHLYFDNAQTFYVSVKRPDGWAEALDNASHTAEPEPEALQAVHKILLDNMMAIPVYNITDNWVFKPNVNDTYYGQFERGILYDAWLS